MTKKILTISRVITLVMCLSFFLLKTQNSSLFSLKINNKDIHLLIADTSALQEQGLSGVEYLPEDTAMLFIFNIPDRYRFWMKDMKFSLDIIWLDEKGKIVYIKNNVSPESYPSTFIPPEKSLYVLEAKGGFAEQNHLVVGNILNIVKK